jgi:hypothetical protein
LTVELVLCCRYRLGHAAGDGSGATVRGFLVGEGVVESYSGCNPEKRSNDRVSTTVPIGT